MSSISNFDLLSVGITIAAIGILGFILFFAKPKSVTSRAFLFFSLVTIFYGSVNYISYQVANPLVTLWFLRLVIFSAVLHAFSFYQLFLVFPNDHVEFSHAYKFFMVPLVIVTSILTLTPIVFTSIIGETVAGSVAQVSKGPGIVLFLFTVATLIITGVGTLVKKFQHAKDIERIQLRFMLIGVFLTFSLITTFNFILPIIFKRVEFIPLGALFMFPFAAFTFYAIAKHHLLDVKVVSTEILTSILALISIIEVIFANSTVALIFRIGMFILILSFSILLIKSVRREIAQREKLEILSKELGTANEKLKLADRVKSQFLSFASHQVKSPMTVIKDYAELIADGSYGTVPDKVKETVFKIKDAANRLLELVGNLLDLRKLEEGKIEYKFADGDLNDLAKNVTEELQPLATEKHLELSFQGANAPMPLKMDAEKIRQVIQNLIDNAIKYTDAGWIKVAAQRASNKYTIVISDSGMGIPNEIIPTLFEQFNRGSEAAKKIQGTGLGLYIAKQFLEAHKGTIHVESPGPGKGSTFTIEFIV